MNDIDEETRFPRDDEENQEFEIPPALFELTGIVEVIWPDGATFHPHPNGRGGVLVARGALSRRRRKLAGNNIQ